MLSRCGLLTKKTGMEREAFKQFWFYDHGPIAAKMVNLRHYSQHLVIDDTQYMDITRGNIVIDGYSELLFNDIYEMEDGVASLKGAGTNDLANFCNDCKLVLFTKKTEVYVPAGTDTAKMVKLVVFLTRKDNVSVEEFQKQWWGNQCALEKNVPGYVGYAQNLVFDRLIGGKHAEYSMIPFDGMAEYWFVNTEEMQKFTASEEWKNAVEGYKSFCSSASSYMIETASYPVAAEQE